MQLLSNLLRNIRENAYYGDFFSKLLINTEHIQQGREIYTNREYISDTNNINNTRAK